MGDKIIGEGSCHLSTSGMINERKVGSYECRRAVVKCAEQRARVRDLNLVVLGGRSASQDVDWNMGRFFKA